ncbi:Endonuclease-reverse transcriptase, partial [Operophtera brumata]
MIELDEQRLEIRKTGKNVTEHVTQNINRMIEDTFLVWEEKHEKLEERVKNQENRIYFLEKQTWKRNMKEIRPRPMIVTFSTLGIKIKILKRKGELKDSQYYLKEDYSNYVLEKRKELQ